MKKNLLLVSFVVLSAASALAGGEGESENLELRCSAQTIDADGVYNPYVKLDCGSEFEGKCVKAVVGSEAYWQIVDPKECDKAATEQGW